jgi:hypothetical protein
VKRLSVKGYDRLGWTATGVVVPLLVGVGMNVLGYSPPDFLLARSCFILAGIFLIVMTTVWLCTNWRPTRRRAIVATALYLLTTSSLGFGMIYVNNREAKAQTPTTPPPVNGNCNNFGNNNTNCNTFNNFGPVRRRLNDDQANSIASYLDKSKVPCNISVETVLSGCADCDGLARQIVDVLPLFEGIKSSI